MLNETDTRAKLVDPKLKANGWTEERIRRDVYITPGMIVNERGKRQEGKKPDYILYANPALPVAIVEAKEEGKTALDGMQQAKDYAQALGCLFAAGRYTFCSCRFLSDKRYSESYIGN